MNNFRYIEKQIFADLSYNKMVFIGGPRQVGKTTLGLSLLGTQDPDHVGYLNWDVYHHRERILDTKLPANQTLFIYDELHKYVDWRNLVKGLYDLYHKKKKFIVMGSARLDYYRRGGDSLQGRYHYYRLHPFTLGELNKKIAVDELLRFGGFPEPLFSQSDANWRRWQNERLKRVISEDLLSLERINEVSKLELLATLLPKKVGAPLSIANIANDLSVSHETANRWISIFESLYLCYRIPPFGYSPTLSVKKEQKLYLWDWSLVQNDEAARFENMVASHLLKYCHFIEDTEGHKMKLFFIRNRDGKEVDFLVSKEGKPIFAVECKLGERALTNQIKYFSERIPKIPFYQVHLADNHEEDLRYRAEIIPITELVKKLGLP